MKINGKRFLVCWKKDVVMLLLRNKLFVIEEHNNYDCKVFNSKTNKFVFVKSLPVIRFIDAVSFGYKIVVFQGNYKSQMLIFCYNKEHNAWIQENDLQLEKRVVDSAKMCKD